MMEGEENIPITTVSHLRYLNDKARLHDTNDLLIKELTRQYFELVDETEEDRERDMKIVLDLGSQINNLNYELAQIKSQWYYKLFNRFT